MFRKVTLPLLATSPLLMTNVAGQTSESATNSESDAGIAPLTDEEIRQEAVIIEESQLPDDWPRVFARKFVSISEGTTENNATGFWQEGYYATVNTVIGD